jgi:hypothetical protein
MTICELMAFSPQQEKPHLLLTITGTPASLSGSSLVRLLYEEEQKYNDAVPVLEHSHVLHIL